MKNEQPSLTALIASFCRAYHSEFDEPKIFHDPLARQLVTDEEYQQITAYLLDGADFFTGGKKAEFTSRESMLKWIVQTQLAPTPLARARYCEDMLANDIQIGARQVVILGAGMDTFAYRNPAFLSKVHVYEIDRPLTQKRKKEKVVQAGWDIPERLHYVPMDFTKDSLSDKLIESGFNTNQTTFFSCMGVTYYLTKDELADMLKAIAVLCTDGSSLLFDYADDQFLSSNVKRVQNQIAMALAAGEPMQAGYDDAELEKVLAEHGFLLYEHLRTSDIEQRFFIGRNDFLHAFEHIHYALAVKNKNSL